MTVRSVAWTASSPLRWVATGLIRAYRLTFAGMFGGQCRFSPSCSHYTEEAIRAHGLIRGAALGSWRILRCNPFGRGGIDEVPTRVAMHDAVIQRDAPAAAGAR
jgi:uncharacterized protein